MPVFSGFHARGVAAIGLAGAIVIATMAIGLLSVPIQVEAATDTPTVTATATSTATLTPNLTPINPPTLTPTPASTTHTSVSISPSSQTVAMSQQFTIDVILDTDQIVQGASVALAFDPTILQVNSVAEGTYFPSWAAANGASDLQYPVAKIDNVNGTVSDFGDVILGASPGTGPTGSALFCSYTVTAVGSGTSSVVLTGVKVALGDGNGTIITDTVVSSGQVMVSPLVTPTSTPRRIFVPTLTFGFPSGW